MQSDPHLPIPAICAVLQTSTLTGPAIEQARPLPDLVAELDRIEPAHQACDYLTVGEVLPDLLDELHVHVATPEDERAHAVALTALVHAERASSRDDADVETGLRCRGRRVGPGGGRMRWRRGR